MCETGHGEIKSIRGNHMFNTNSHTLHQKAVKHFMHCTKIANQSTDARQTEKLKRVKRARRGNIHILSQITPLCNAMSTRITTLMSSVSMHAVCLQCTRIKWKNHLSYHKHDVRFIGDNDHTVHYR